MSIELKDGVLTINAQYGITVNRGDYSSEKFSEGLTLAYAVDGDATQALAEGQAQQATLAKLVKLAVIEELGLDAKVDDKGTFLADFGSAPKAAPVAQAAPQAAPYGGGGQQFAPPKVSKEVVDAQPVITADLDGRGVTTYRDLRGLKAAPGTAAGPGQYSAKAADFRDLADPKHQVWLRDKQGNIQANVAAALEAIGGTVQ